MQDHIDRHPLGAWVCASPDGLVANHIPFLLDRQEGTNGHLLGHVSRGNSVWKALADGTPCVVMFMGPQAYISPSWYPGKQAHGKVVPTWNYITVHAHGIARVRNETEWKLDLLTRLTASQENSRPSPWQLSDAPSDYLHRLLEAVVGIEISIDRLEGKRKLSQDEDAADRLGTAKGLLQEDSSEAKELARWVK